MGLAIIALALSVPIGGARACSPTLPPIAAVRSVSVYRPGDRTNSIVDPQAKRLNDRLAAPMRDFQHRIGSLADAAAAGDAGAADCLAAQLRAWAAARALLATPVSANAAFNRSWLLASIGLAIVKADRVTSMRRDPVVRSWLAALGAQERGFTASRKKVNNLTYWSALALLSSSIVTGDRMSLTFADRLNEQGLTRLKATGVLPEEAARGTRAAHYLYFGAQPLFVYELLRSRYVEPRALPAPLRTFLDKLAPAIAPELLGSLPPGQEAPRETGWMSLYCRLRALRACRFDGSVPIARLAGRPDRLGRALNIPGY